MRARRTASSTIGGDEPMPATGSFRGDLETGLDRPSAPARHCRTGWRLRIDTRLNALIAMDTHTTAEI